MGEFIYIRPATSEEKPIKTSKGYSVWKCECGNIIVRRNDCIPKVCNCKNNRGKKKLTFERKREIANFYKLQPIRFKDVCDKFDITEPTLIKILKTFKCKVWSRSLFLSPELNESYFENIDTKEKAYFLGLLITDGNVFVKNNCDKVSITLQDCDKYLIEQFCNEIKSNKKITSDGRGSSGVQICSQKMCEDLRKYHIVPNKTFTVELPEINDEYMSHFLRGCIDGDGSIGFYERKNRTVHRKIIRLCSASKVFLDEINEYLYNKLGVNGYITQEHNGTLFQINYTKNKDLYKLIKYLYKDATIFMKRKYDKVLLIKNELENTEITKRTKDLLAS